VPYLDYDWPQSPCVRLDSQGRTHAFWSQIGSDAQLQPHRRDLEYWVRNPAGWTDRGADLDPYESPGLGEHLAMDLTVTGYATWDDLLGYMDGSAAVIGEMMLPILEPLTPDALEPARDLGNAFQLTNFLRDVAEDLDRGRVYLPREDLDRFGADPARRAVDQPWRQAMAFEIDRARALYRSADRGAAMLPPSSARCIRAARTLYSEILDRIEASGYDVFTHRATVPTWRKATLAGRMMIPPRG